MNIHAASDHTKNERKTRDAWIENILEDWGAWRRDPITGLSSPTRSTLQTIHELHLEQGAQAKSKPIPADTPLWKRHWLKDKNRALKCLSTRQIAAKIPNYSPNRFMARVNTYIAFLPIELSSCIRWRYEDEKTYQIVEIEHHISKSEYYRRLAEARKRLKQALNYRQLPDSSPY